MPDLCYNDGHIELVMNGSPTHASHIASEGVWERTRFVMLGTMHREPSGGDALAQWLHILEPDVITLEFSEYGLQYRQTHARRLLRELDRLLTEMKAEGEPVEGRGVESLRSYIGLPYEYVAASGYADRCGVPLYLVDLDDLSRLKLQYMDELLSRENLGSWFREYDGGVSDESREWVLARLFFDKGTKAFSHTEEMLMRDRQIREKVSSLMAEHQDKRFVHVCGWQHLADPQGIYAVLNPAKVFVHDRSLRV